VDETTVLIHRIRLGFLRSEEYDNYQDGKRVFGLWGPDSSSTAAKVRVTDELVEGLNRWIEEDEPESGSTLNPSRASKSTSNISQHPVGQGCTCSEIDLRYCTPIG